MKKKTKTIKSNEHYRKNIYRIQKKLSVEDNAVLKDYAKQDLYIYIIHESINNYRFVYLSSKHYEEGSKINPFTFKLEKISNKSESIYLNKKINMFKDIYFNVSEKNKDITINLSKFIFIPVKKYFTNKYKVHTKKIAIDNPNFYLDNIKSFQIKSYKKKFEKEIYRSNDYDEEIKEHFISTLFTLKDNKFQMFNDHSIIMDEGKTGKSSLIAYLSQKCDNISIAGLYGSSDSKAGKFRGGLVTLTKKNIVIDEVNELAQNQKEGKILSILNTILENGVYNYVKQFSAKIESSNQFTFMGNISDNFDFSLFLDNVVGNTLTIGRRIGIITYNNNLKGFKKGQIRTNPSQYVEAINILLTNILNFIMYETKFYIKLIEHKNYSKLETYYKKELSKLIKTIENEITINFIKSHSESINRIVFRALKLYIYENTDNYLSENKPYYNNELPYIILQKTKILLDKNILNIKNICDHVNISPFEDRKIQRNINNFEELPKTHKVFLKVFFDNQDLINLKGVEYEQILNKTEIKRAIYEYKNRKNPSQLINTLKKWGCRLEFKKDKIIFGFTRKSIFLQKIEGIFNNEPTQINIDEDVI